MTQKTKDFKLHQFNCNHCTSNQIKQITIDKLQELKDTLNLNIFIVSSYRCKIHNKNLGGRPSYSKGLAVDIKAAGDDDRILTGKELLNIIDEYSLMDDFGVGIGENIITLDFDVDYERWNR